MTEWTKVKLGDIATFSNGINFGKDSYCQGVKLIGVSDFGNRFYPDYSSLQEVKTEVVRNNDYLKNGDIVFVRSNGNKELVGRCMLIAGCHPFVTFSGFCIRARLNDTSKFNPLYFAYHFKNMEFRKAMSGTAVGANIQNLSQGRLAQYETMVPNIAVQNKIAAILSRYDDLIENYQKQIKLLKEAAQRLYKEWFVDLHFPGHENVKVVDGVPEGWENVSVGSLVSKVHRTKQIPTSKVLAEGDIPVIDQSRTFIAGYTNDKEALIKVDKPVIVFGDHTRILKYITFSFAKGADGTQLILSNNLKRMPQSLFYCSLVNVDLSNYSYARHFKYLKAEDIVLPTEQIASDFDKHTSLCFEKIHKLRSQLRLLTEARDRLLPKLMSGEIEV